MRVCLCVCVGSQRSRRQPITTASNCKSSLRQLKLFALSQVHVHSLHAITARHSNNNRGTTTATQQLQQHNNNGVLCVAGQGAHLSAFSDKPRPPCHTQLCLCCSLLSSRSVSLSPSLSFLSYLAIHTRWQLAYLQVAAQIGMRLVKQGPALMAT